MNTKTAAALALAATAIAIALPGSVAAAAASAPPDVFSNVLNQYSAVASTFSGPLLRYATGVFWSLVTISMVITFGFLGLRKADIGEFFAEFLKFTLTTGIFFWLLTSSPLIGNSIIESLRDMAGEATGLGRNLYPSDVAQLGFDLFFSTVEKAEVTSPLVSLTAIALSLFSLMLVAYLAMEMVLLIVAAWMLLYGGVFFLGFGGSRWTSDIAINYYKTVLALGASLLGMTLVVGVAASMMDQYYKAIGDSLAVKDLAVVAVVAFCAVRLADRIPSMMAGIVTGSGIGHGSWSGVSTGAAMGGAATFAASAMGTATSLAGAGIAGAAGGASAIMAAMRQGQANTAAGADIMSRMGASLGSWGAGGGNSGSGGDGRSLAEQMGMSGQGVAALAGPSASGSWAGGQSTGQGGGSTSTTGASASASAGRTMGATQNQGAGPSTSTARGANAGTPGGSAGATGTGNNASAQGQGQGQGQGQKGSGLASARIADTATGGMGRVAGAVGGALGAAGRIAADAAANLALGGADVVAAKVGELAEAARERIGETWGGQVATAIRERGERLRGGEGQQIEGTIEAADFPGLEPATAPTPDELAAFVNRS